MWTSRYLAPFLLLFTYLFIWPHRAAWGFFVPWLGIEPRPWAMRARVLITGQPGNSWSSTVLKRPSFPLCPAVISLSYIRGLYLCSSVPQLCLFYWSVYVSLCFSWQKFVLIPCWLNCYNFIISFSMWLCKSISCFSSRFSWLFLALCSPIINLDSACKEWKTVAIFIVITLNLSQFERN